jgi:hypothetical protein
MDEERKPDEEESDDSDGHVADGPAEIEDAAQAEIEYPADESDEG